MCIGKRFWNKWRLCLTNQIETALCHNGRAKEVGYRYVNTSSHKRLLVLSYPLWYHIFIQKGEGEKRQPLLAFLSFLITI